MKCSQCDIQICKCGNDIFHFFYCNWQCNNTIDCPGHWVCDNCGEEDK